MNNFYFLHILSAASYARFGNSYSSWPLKPQDPFGNSGQDSRATIAASQIFSSRACLTVPKSACETHCSVGFHPMLLSSWKTPNNLSSVLVLSISPNSWQLLKRTNGLAMESWDFDSWSQIQLQVPPPAPTQRQSSPLPHAPSQLSHHRQRGHWNPAPLGPP